IGLTRAPERIDIRACRIGSAPFVVTVNPKIKGDTTMQSTVQAEAKAEATAAPETGQKTERKTLNVVLWVIQGLLALQFLYAGVIKFVMPVEQMTKQMPGGLSGNFLHFIGVCEVLGALGLILPGILRVRPGLTPLAASGLVIIMAGATVLTAIGGQVGMAAIPLVGGALPAFIAFGRWRLAPLRGKSAKA